MTYRTGTRGLFIPGPTNVPDRVRRAVDLPMEDHRAPDQPDFLLPLLADLKKIFKTETGTPILFPGSGTGGWEAALTNTLSPGDRVLIARFGQFSHLWVDMCERLGLKVDIVECPWGTGVPLETFSAILEADRERRIKAVLVTQNETATGVTSDVAGVRKALSACDHPAMLMVDGVSSIASIDFRMDEWGVDVAVSGSQKGFMLPAGLAITCFSQKAIMASRSAQLRRCYFDIADMLKTNELGYFPYTPPMTLLRGLRTSVDMLLDEGLENVFTRHARMGGAVRAAVEAWGLRLCAQDAVWHSDTVTAILVPEGHDAKDLITHAYYRYGISYGAGLSKVAGKVFRIGHLGDMNEIMILGAITSTELVMRDMGIPFEMGAGSAAAVDFLHATGQQEEARIAAE